jgi:hypothetical protein
MNLYSLKNSIIWSSKISFLVFLRLQNSGSPVNDYFPVDFYKFLKRGPFLEAAAKICLNLNHPRQILVTKVEGFLFRAYLVYLKFKYYVPG